MFLCGSRAQTHPEARVAERWLAAAVVSTWMLQPGIQKNKHVKSFFPERKGGKPALPYSFIYAVLARFFRIVVAKHAL